MRVTFLIDNLGQGGAQRQLCYLADNLQHRGHTVSVVTYHSRGFFDPWLRDHGIEPRYLQVRGALAKVRTVRSALSTSRPDVVMAFLPMPSLYAELAGALGRRWGLIVSERSSTPDWQSLRLRLRRMFHRLADAVVTNSHANRLMLEKSVAGLQGRVSTVYNMVDFSAYPPAPLPERQARQLRIVVPASYQRLKNVRGWIGAMKKLVDRQPDIRVETDWYGGRASVARGAFEREAASRLAEQYGLSERVRLHDATSNIVSAYHAAHAIALPSLYEGLPNAVCEGMAVGRPVAASAVSDAGNLIVDGETGVLFDPTNVDEMAMKVAELARADTDVLREMGDRAHARARELFDPETVTGFYVRILEAAAQRRTVPPVFWPEEVPATAYATLQRPCAS